jgi:aquaporin Z
MAFRDAIFEGIGCFMFILIILVSGNPMLIAFGLLGSIYAASAGSKGILNPAVIAALISKGDMSVELGSWYIAGEVAGALAAVSLYSYGKKLPVDHWYNLTLRET